MANYNVTTAGASLEFDTVGVSANSCFKVDTNHFINFYAGGGDSDGFVEIFAVNTSTWAITTTAARLEYDTQNGTFASCYQVDDNHFVNFWRGDAGLDGYTQVFEVNTSTWAVTTAAASLEFDTQDCTYSSCAQIDTNHFINFWYGRAGSGASLDGQAQVFVVNTSTWEVTTAGAAFAFNGTANASYNACFKTDTNHFINFFAGVDGDGFAQTFEVNTTTWEITTSSTQLEFDTQVGSYNACYQVDTTHFINFWSGVGNDGFVQVFEVNPITYAVTTSNSSLEFNATDAYFNSCYKIDTNHFINFSGTVTSVGVPTVIEVNTSTWAVTTKGTSITLDNALAFDNSCAQIDTDHYINFGRGTDNDGFAQVVKVNASASLKDPIGFGPIPFPR